MERLNVAPGVWANVDKGNAGILKTGALFAFLVGVSGGFCVMSLIEPKDADAAWIMFCVGYGGFGALGMMVGLVTGAIRAGRRINTGVSR
ncbi:MULTISPECIES: hypothetical protein [unclassified Leisingera]|uniref:hypothetical protein n=1 Tax=unclassified Leisingera TaxID=2614906 RepID=UPI0021A5F0F9|nr:MULTISPECIES: hypothetical protein [unclassified Leisingera]UWQ30602.1 hypothetical protein K3557_08780 [Leisingera sp. M523]UWQ76704.1 hypothetical protein K3724_09875 [Leisingera sp. M658]